MTTRDQSGSTPSLTAVREEAERLLKDITPALWQLGYDGTGGGFEVGVGYRDGLAAFVIASRSDVYSRAEESRANAHLIAAAPRLVRDLLALVTSQAADPQQEALGATEGASKGGDMKRFVVYEVWTRSRIVDAISEEAAYDAEPTAPTTDGLSLCNWHAVEVPDQAKSRQLHEVAR